MIDLRSDTVTKPTPAMRAAMVEAEVGDDVYGEDPTVAELEERVADLFGKERGLFVASGVLGNQLCLKSLTNPGDEVILGANSHIFNYETGAPALLSGIQVHTIPDDGGALDLASIDDAIRADAYYMPKSAVVAQEQTHNREGGRIIPFEHMQSVVATARSHGIATHLDGARIWNALIGESWELGDVGPLFDTVSVCLSKGLGAPVGSVIVGDETRIDTAHKFRKIWGGGWRQAGMLAAAGLYALDHHVDRLADDHANARAFYDIVAPVIDTKATPPPQSNIVVIPVDRHVQTDIVQELAGEGVLVSGAIPGAIRAVFHLDVAEDEATRAAEATRTTLSEFAKESTSATEAAADS